MTRKKVLLGVLLLVYLCASAAESQTIQVGLKGGINSTTIGWSTSPLGDQMGELHRRQSVAAGVVLTVSGLGNLRLRTEVLYSGKGFSETQGIGTVIRARVNYVEVPLLVGWTFPSGSVVPEVYAGPWVGWETACELSQETGVNDLAYDCDEIPGEPVSRETTDWGMAVGMTMTIPAMGRLSGFFDVRYSAGLRNLDASPRLVNMDLHHRGYSITGGFLVAFGS